MHVEFTTALMRFVDDVEFRLGEQARAIQIRSASRVGYSDLGTNRKRMEEIREMFVRRLQTADRVDQAVNPPRASEESP